MKGIFILFSLLVTQSFAGIINLNEDSKIFYYRQRIHVALEVLQNKCPGSIIDGVSYHFPVKRELLSSSIHLLIEQNHLGMVMSELAKCLVALSLPSQCKSNSTLNLNETWRKETNGSGGNTEGKYDVGTLDEGRAWFRFTGAAGRMLRNTCPPSEASCGSNDPHWSDDPMPTETGQTLDMKFYEYRSNCKNRYVEGVVTRCSSAPGDFVYKINGKMAADRNNVCGMDVN